MEVINLPAQPALGELMAKAMQILVPRYRRTIRDLEKKYGLGQNLLNQVANKGMKPKKNYVKRGLKSILKDADVLP